MKIGYIALLSCLLAACASNSSQSTGDNARAANSQPDPEGKICRYEIPTGSTIRQKVCTTKAERERQNEVDPSLLDPRHQNTF